MKIVAGDHLGNIHIADCASQKIQRSDQAAGIDKSVRCLSWSGSGLHLCNEISIGRQDGLIQAFNIDPSLVASHKHLQLPSPIAYISYLNPNPEIIDALSRFNPSSTSANNSSGLDLISICHKYRYAPITAQPSSFFDPASYPYHNSSFNSLNEKLFCVTENGHACIVPWGSDYTPINHETLSYKTIPNTWNRKHKITNGNSTSDSFSPGFYHLPGPISCANIHPWLPNLLSFGGSENDVKIFDCLSESIVWAARNVKRSILDLRYPVDVTALQWLPKINVNVLAAASKFGKVRIYDLRAQRRPVHEAEITQEKRPITSMCTFLPTHEDSLSHLDHSKSQSDHLKKSPLVNLVSSASEWPFYISDTYGMIYKMALSKLESSAGESTLNQLDNYTISHHGNFKDQMGSTTELRCSNDGKWLLSVGLGRYALIYNTQSRRLNSKIYLKQKLRSCLIKQSRKVQKRKVKEIRDSTIKKKAKSLSS